MSRHDLAPRHTSIRLAVSDPTSLGAILIRKGYATPEQVDKAIQRQLQTTPPIGEILLEMGAITADQLDEALYEQRKARGEITKRDEVEYHLSRQSRHASKISQSLSDIATLAHALSAKLGRAK